MYNLGVNMYKKSRYMFKKFLVSLLIIALLSTCSGYYNIISKAAEAVSEVDINLQTDKSDQTISEDTAQDSSDIEAEIVKELPEERTEYSTVWLNDDGSYTARFYSSPVRYKDDNNNLVDIDSSLIVLKDDNKNIDNSTYDYSTKATEVKTYLPSVISKENPVLVSFKDYNVKLIPIEYSETAKQSLKENTLSSKNAAELVNSQVTDLYDKISEKVTGLKYSGAKDSINSSVDIEYIPLNEGVKENIILNSVPESNKFSFWLEINNAYPEMTEYGAILFKDNKTKEEIGAIPAPYMFDSSEDTAYSTDVHYELTEAESGYILTVVVSEEYLNCTDRVYPVTIDPTVTFEGNDEVRDVYIKSGYPNTNFYSSDTRLMPVGYGSELISRTLVKFPGLQSTISEKIIRAAGFHAKEHDNSSTFCKVKVWRITESWASNTVTWNNRPSISDFSNDIETNTGSDWHLWSVTELVGKWASGDWSNYGLMMRATVENSSNYDDYYGSRTTATDYRPYLNVNYENPSTLAEPVITSAGVSSGVYDVDLTFTKVTGASKYYLNITGTGENGLTKTIDLSGEDVTLIDNGSTYTWSTAYNDPALSEEYGGFPNSSADTILNGDGGYKFSIKAVNAYDTGVNSNEKTIYLDDNTAPNEVELLSQAIVTRNTEFIDTADISISFTNATDNPTAIAVGVDYYKVELFSDEFDVVAEQQIDETGLDEYSCTFSNVNCDLITPFIRITAYDGKGNYSLPTDTWEATIIPDYERPTKPTLVINPSNYANQNEITIMWAGLTDNRSADDNVDVFYQLATGTEENPTYIGAEEQIGTGQIGSIKKSIENLTEGQNYLVFVYGKDESGNVSIKECQTLLKDLTAPTADITSPVEESEIDGSVSIVGDINDTNIANWTLYYKKTGFPWLSSYTQIAEGEENVDNSQIALVDTSTFTAGAEYRFMLVVTDKAGNETVIYRNYTKTSEGSIVLPDFEINPNPREDWEINTYDYTFTLDPDFSYTIPDGQRTLFIDGNYIGTFGTNDDIEADLSNISSFPDSSVHNAVVRIVDSTTGEESYSSTVIKRDLFTYDMTPNTDLTASGDAVLTASGASLDLSQASPTSGNIITAEKTISGKIASIKLSAADTTPANTTVKYYLSINSSSYFEIAKDTRVYAEQLTTLGIQNNDTSNSVKVKVVMESADGITAPTVTSLDVDSTQFTSNANSLFYLTYSPYGVKTYQDFTGFDTQSGDAVINPLTGNMIYSTSDLSIDSPTGLLEFSRTYNSQGAFSTVLGQGWDYNYNINITKILDENDQEKAVLLKFGDGDVYRFEKNQDSSYTGPNGFYGTLTYDSQTSKYQLTYNDKSVYLFNTDNYIQKITDRNGNWIQFTYNTNGIATITDNVGNNIAVTYSAETGEEGLIKTISGSNKTYTYIYDANRRLIQSYIVKDSENVGEQYVYTNGALSKIINPIGSEYKIKYNSDNKIVKMIDGINQAMTFDYVSENDDIKFTTKYLDTINTYYYDGTTLALKNVADSYENSTVYSYDNKFNITNIEYADETTESYTYDSNGNVLTFTNKAGNDTVYTYGDANNPDLPTLISEPFNGTEKKITQNVYDVNGNLISTSVQNTKRATTYTYDTLGNVLTEILTITDGANTYTSETDYIYDGKGRLLSTTVIDNENSLNNIVTSQTYDSYGNVDTQTDANGVVTKYYYNILGQTVQQTNAYGTANAVSTYSTYDNLGNVLTETDANNNTTTYVYDAAGRQFRTIYPNGKSEYVKYDGYTTEATDADGNDSISVEDKNGQTILSGTPGQTGTGLNNEVTEGSQGVYENIYEDSSLIEYAYTEYDNMGNAIETTDNTGAVTANEYDEMGQVESSTVKPDAESEYGLETAYTYDDAGNVLTQTAPDSTTITTYDKLSRPLNVSVSGGSGSTEYTYDSVVNGKLVNTMTDAEDRTTTYTFDCKGRLIWETIGTKTTQYTYDANGNLLTSTLTDGAYPTESAETVYTYDELNRNTSVTYSEDDEYILYAYDNNGNVLQKSLYENDTLSTTSEYTYDVMNRMIQEERDNEVIAIYEYTDSGNLASIQNREESEDSFVTITGYTYDEAGKIIKVRDLSDGNHRLLREYFYEDGQLSHLEDNRTSNNLPDDEKAKQEFGYDDYGRLTSVKYYDVEGENVLEEYTVTYDDNNRITQEYGVTRYGEQPVVTTKSYTYDSDGRLASETANNVTTTYTYDDVGNRLTMTQGTDVYEYNYNSTYDQLTSIELNNVPQTTFAYDLSGNQTSKTEGSVVTTYTYDDANWLKSVTQGTNTLGTYSYDANGQRRQKVVGSEETNYYYSGIKLLYTENAEGGIIEEYCTEPDGSIIRSTQLSYWPDFEEYSLEDGFFYRYDIRGSVTNIVYNDDALIKSYTYDAYGNTQSAYEHEQVIIPNSIAYTGAVNDNETGLYYMNARYYDPETGRFISQDTYRGTGEAFWHLYLYCDSDPVNNIDPTGHNPGELFNTMDLAARDAAFYMNKKSISENREYGTSIYEVRKTTKKISGYKTHRFLWWTWKTPVYKVVTTKIGYSYSTPVRGTAHNVFISPASLQVAQLHTHGAYESDYVGDDFSPKDISSTKRLKATYLATPKGTLRKYTQPNGPNKIIYYDIPYDPKHPSKQ